MKASSVGDHPVNRETARGRPPSLALEGHRGDGGSNRLPRTAGIAGGGFRWPRARFRSPAARALSFTVLHEVEERTPRGGDRSARTFGIARLGLSRCQDEHRPQPYFPVLHADLAQVT